MSQIANPQFRCPSTDAFEAVEFDATDLNDPTAAGLKANPKVTFLTSSGQRLTMPLVASAAQLTKLATWAAEVAAKLVEQGRA